MPEISCNVQLMYSRTADTTTIVESIGLSPLRLIASKSNSTSSKF